MAAFETDLIDILNDIQGSGSFVVSGTKDFMPLGLTIDGVDEISFPIAPKQIAAMIKAAHKAPFGKGSETIVDPNVRSAWEIDAKDISFRNKSWSKYLDDLLEVAKSGLGLEKHSVSANLYKLLIYETGDFFLPHKDSEKEPGMFGTLIIGLPSRHTGGSLFVRFNGEEEIIDFSDAENDYKLPFTAFFADCEHEIKPLTSGYRVCLVYNLVQKQEGQARIQLADTQEHIKDLAEVLATRESDRPFAVLLGHQYTPANFSMETLKLDDYPRADALLKAAENAGFHSKLGLVTCYQMGDLEVEYSRSSRRRGRYYDEYDDDDATENGQMGSDIHEESIRIEHWGTGDKLPPLSKMEFDEGDIITDMELRDGEPDEKAAEGYTGNAGMTMEYWYHYGAIVLWRKSDHFALLNKQNVDARLKWLTYYAENWAQADRKSVKKLLTNFSENDLRVVTYDVKDFSPVAAVLKKMDSEKFIDSDECQALLAQIFDRISVSNWLALILHFDVRFFKSIFKKAAASSQIANVKHITAILEGLQTANTDKMSAFLMKRLGNIPNYLDFHKLDNDSDAKHIRPLVDNLLRLSALKNDDETWLTETTNSLAKSLSRKYVNDILAESLLALGDKKNLNLAKRLFIVCQQDLIRRTETKPTPPKTWTREVPTTPYSASLWAILKPFLESPTQQVFDYARVQADRSAMESIIRNVTIDLRMETIRKGSPHTLRLTKTQDAYQADLKRWEIDVALLRKIEGFYSK